MLILGIFQSDLGVHGCPQGLVVQLIGLEEVVDMWLIAILVYVTGCVVVRQDQGVLAG